MFKNSRGVSEAGHLPYFPHRWGIAMVQDKILDFIQGYFCLPESSVLLILLTILFTIYKIIPASAFVKRKFRDDGLMAALEIMVREAEIMLIIEQITIEDKRL